MYEFYVFKNMCGVVFNDTCICFICISSICYLENFCMHLSIFTCILLGGRRELPAFLLRNNSLASYITMNFLNMKNKELNQDDIILLIVNVHSGSH